jgi:hypothetical protein
MMKIPQGSVSGLFWFAIHTSTPGVFLYHMPKYLLMLLSEEKKPSSKIWPEETKVWLPLIACPGLMVSAAMQNSKNFGKAMRQSKRVGRENVSINTLTLWLNEIKKRIQPKGEL